MTDGIERFVHGLERGKRTAPSVTDVRRIPAQPAQYGEFTPGVAAPVRRALASRGVERPYVHQSRAWEAIEAGKDVVIVTPTASGKTLCYNAPIVSMLGGSRDGCALYLYPTKALSQDQCAELNGLLDACGLDEEAQVYDGDTPADIRRRVRDTVRAVLTNPDMLHTSILPHHDKWRRVFSTLRYVVVDEMHTYRGVFGSHVANVFRRLRRICRHYGADPQFVFTSATIANPAELAQSLTGRRAEVVDESGAPVGERFFVLYNPPIMDAELQRRQSPGAAARNIAARLVRAGHHTIVFTRSRREVEIVSRKLKENFERKGENRLARATTGYRGGYLPEERRRIERALRGGEIACVVSTNALELGIDIGSLDACIIAGYPGTIASSWQQAGRAGRRQTASLSMLVAGDNPVDQYLVNHPDYFFGASPEHARIDPDNLRILSEHLKCAVFELPFGQGDGFGELDAALVQDVLAYLAEEARLLTPRDGAWHWSAESYPAGTVNIRDILDENFVIVDTSDERHPKILGEIDFESAHKTVHLHAIYTHAARLYEVHRLDYPERKAYVRAVEPEYFTQAIDQTRVFVLDRLDDDDVAPPDPAPRGWGEVRVTTRYTGYKKIRFKTFENIGYGEIALPDLEKHTTAYWVTFPSGLLAPLGLDATALSGGIHGIGRALHTVALVHLMCASGDLHVTVGSRVGPEPDVASEPLPLPGLIGDGPTPISRGNLLDDPTVYLYDNCPGGVGFSEKLHDLHTTLLGAALELVEGCPCEDGCPSCVGPRDLVTPDGRRAATAILRAALR
jgi:DEAD/DEAH box helicase domain-containing protein